MMLLLFLGLSLGCLSNNHCKNNSILNSSKPFCNPDTSSCEECYTDSHCRNNTSCNSVCNNLTFTCSVQIPNLQCSSGTVCYEALGKCVGRCYSDSDCSLIPFVFRQPNTGVCDLSSGKCYDCLVTSDCKPFRNETCNARCTFSQRSLEYQCSDGNLCGSGTFCRELIPNGSVYRCSQGNTESTLYILFVLIFFIFI